MESCIKQKDQLIRTDVHFLGLQGFPVQNPFSSGKKKQKMDPNAGLTAVSYYNVCLVFIFGSELVHILFKMSSAKKCNTWSVACD